MSLPTKSGRVLRIWPNFTKVGPSSVSAVRRRVPVVSGVPTGRLLQVKRAQHFVRHVFMEPDAAEQVRESMADEDLNHFGETQRIPHALLQ